MMACLKENFLSQDNADLHSEHGFLVPSRELCQNWLRHMKGHSLSPRSCPATWSATSERLGY